MNVEKKRIALSDFPVTLPIRVAWGEMDAFQHVNNAVFFRYFENARILYFQKTNMTYDQVNGIGPILAEISCKFIRPLYYPTTVTVGASVTSCLEDRFVMSYGMFSEDKKVCFASGDSTVMAFDYKKKQKSMIPHEWLGHIKRINAELA